MLFRSKSLYIVRLVVVTLETVSQTETKKEKKGNAEEFIPSRDSVRIGCYSMPLRYIESGSQGH